MFGHLGLDGIGDDDDVADYAALLELGDVIVELIALRRLLT
jgi:hypothetical protein